MEDLLARLTENPVLFILVVVLAIGFLISLFKAAFRIAAVLIVLIICGMVVFDVQSPEELVDKGMEVAKQTIDSELEEAETTFNDDGSFVIKTTSLSMSKEKDAEHVVVRYKDHEYDVSLETLKEWIKDEEIKQKIEESLDKQHVEEAF